MYRYVEQEKYEGKTCLTGGVTKRSLLALKHLPKIGVPRYVRGYLYKGRHGVNHIGVIVRGTKGSMRFGGFGWGYGGEGPRGLKRLFEALNITLDPTYREFGEWPSFRDTDLGEHWRINFTWTKS